MTLLFVLSLIATLGPISHSATPQPATSTAPTTAPTAASPASPQVSPSAASLPTSAPPAPAPPAVVATLPPSAYAYRFVPRQPTTLTPGQPQIFAVYLNAERLHSHGPILIRVETNETVVKMESKSNGRGGALPQLAPGVFGAQSSLPGIPFIARGMSTDLLFIGTSADGRTVTVRVPVQLG